MNIPLSVVALCVLFSNGGEILSVSPELNCENQTTTLEINRCMALELEAAEEVMETYLAKSKERYASDRQIIQSLDKAQTAWTTYRQSHCDSVFDVWRTGTIRTSMSLTCSIQLTQQRTMDLWHSFLTYADSTPPLLPKPSVQDL